MRKPLLPAAENPTSLSTCPLSNSQVTNSSFCDCNSPSTRGRTPNESSPSRIQTHFPLIWITQFLEKFLSRTRLTYWVRNGSSELQPAVFCPDLGTAMAVHVILNGAMRVCPHCGTIFTAQHLKQQYTCSVRCREAHRIARFRAR